MQQRRATASGRPLGTDGSDFSYRMVVDSRYTKVAKGKARLQLLIVIQDRLTGKMIGEGREGGIYRLNQTPVAGTCHGDAAATSGSPLQWHLRLGHLPLDRLRRAISQVVGAFLAFVSASNIKKIDSFAILSITIGFVSIIIGELGRQRSLATLLRLFTTTSSMATALSVAHIVRRDFFFGAIQNWSISSMKTLEMFEASRVLFGVLLQMVVIITSTSLVQNMSPKRV